MSKPENDGGASGRGPSERRSAPKSFKVGDRVSWNSEAGRVSGTIIRVHVRDVDYKGHRRHASAERPQYEIKSSKTDHIAMHLGAALTRLRGKAKPGKTADRQKGEEP